MGWHRYHAISHIPNQIVFEDTFVSHPGGTNEQFGIHEKLSWGGGGGGVQGNLNWMPGYKASYKSLNEFVFRQHPITYFGVSSPLSILKK